MSYNTSNSDTSCTVESTSSTGHGQKEGYSLDRRFYNDPAIFEVEIATVLQNNWLCVGHVARIPHTGDYFLFELASDSVIVIRGEDGVVRALANVCRHRGSQICTEESGSAKRLVCPYHRWVY